MTSTNNTNVPQAREAMNQFKYEVANEIGVPLKQGYNGDLTSSQAGYVGGYMVKNMCPARHKDFRRKAGVRNMGMLRVRYRYILMV